LGSKKKPDNIAGNIVEFVPESNFEPPEMEMKKKETNIRKMYRKHNVPKNYDMRNEKKEQNIKGFSKKWFQH
jgi:hypothetical protein